MAFSANVALVFYLLVCLIRNTVTVNFRMERGRYDSFVNLECEKSQQCTEKQCMKYAAQCTNEECKRCRCDEERSTFIYSNSTTAFCLKDEDIIAQTVPKESFRLKNNEYNRCLAVRRADRASDRCYGANCSSSLELLWMWMKRESTGTLHLMNVKTLKCLEFLVTKSVCSSIEKYQIGEVAMKQCNETEGQYMIKHNSYNIHSKLCGTRYYYLKFKLQGEHPNYLAESRRTWVNQTWKNEGRKLHRKHSKYTGCYRFEDENIMLYVDNDTCRKNPCSHKFSAPIFFQYKNCGIRWPKSKILQGDANWQRLKETQDTTLVSIQPFSAEYKTLMVTQRALEVFNGSLLRLAISCENEMNKEVEEHCLLIKFKTMKAKMEASYNMTNTSTTGPMKISTKLTTIKTSVKLARQDTEEGPNKTIVIAIAVPLLAVILVLVLVYFMCYRKRKRSERAETSTTEMSERNSLLLVKSPNSPSVDDPQSSPRPSQILHAIPKQEYENQDDQATLTLTENPDYVNPLRSTYECPHGDGRLYTSFKATDSEHSTLHAMPMNMDGEQLIPREQKNEKPQKRKDRESFYV